MDSPEASGTDFELRTDWDRMHSALDIDSTALMNEALGSSMGRRMLHGVLGELEEQRSLEEELQGAKFVDKS